MRITKRNGAIHLYDEEKVTRSILQANANVPSEDISPAMAAALSDLVFERVTKKQMVTTADVHDCVYALLNEKGFTETARCYDEYKKKK